MIDQIDAFNAIAAAVGIGAVGVATAYLMRDNHARITPTMDLSNQSMLLDKDTCHRVSWKSQPPDHFGIERLYPECTTLHDVLLHGRKMSNNGRCFGSRTGPNGEYVWLTYQEVIDRVQQFGSALLACGEKPQNDNFVAIFASNSIEWSVADFGALSYGMCPVPLYDILGQEATAYVLNQCNIKLVVCDTAARLKILLDTKADVPRLCRIVMTEPYSPELAKRAEDLGVQLFLYKDFMELGQQNLKEVTGAKPTDLFSICYTSGTTGKPKGVMITHERIIIMVETILAHLKPIIELTPDDITLSYLPHAHNFGRAVVIMLMLVGAQVGFYSRDVTLLMDDLAALKPTLFPSVPRLLNRVYDAVHNEVKHSAIKSFLLRIAISAKHKQVQRGIYRRDTIWDKLIFQKIQAKLGGRVKLVIAGSAPLSVDVINFLRCALGCVVMEGYGQTEVGAGITFSLVEDVGAGTVGPPLPGVHVKLEDVPDMGFFAKDNIGEVCAKTPYTMSGYYKQPEVTAETIDQDGWLHTGDIGSWAENGTLRIVDRKKHLFKLAQGEYISPEKIEIAYGASPFVAQSFVDGDSLKPCVMGVVVPDPTYLEKWGPRNNMPSDIKEFCRHKDAKGIVLTDLLAYGKKANLKGLEQVKDIVLEPEAFTIENGLITPTMKSVRPALRRRYKEQFAQLYKHHGV